MRIHIATDHAGLDFSTQLQEHLAAAGHEVLDHGPVSYDPVDDYPAFCIKAAEAVMADAATGVQSLGVVFGGSGNGEQIAANKVPGIRAAQTHDPYSAERAAKSNNAHIITMGARVIGPELAKAIADAWLAQTMNFDPKGRSAGNVSAIDDVEAKYMKG